MSSKGQTAVAGEGTRRLARAGNRSRTMRLGAAVVLASSLALGCGDPTTTPDTCLPPSTVDSSAPITRVGVHFVAGSAPLLIGNQVTSANGAAFKTTKARLYLSQVALIGQSRERVGAELVDAQGHRLPYGVTLVDLERPESLNVYVQAPAGTYRGMAVSVGVPETCWTGATLNHSDASSMEMPLDVDSDMYWSWNSGYVFLKFEGQVQDTGAWKNFFYHVATTSASPRSSSPHHSPSRPRAAPAPSSSRTSTASSYRPLERRSRSSRTTRSGASTVEHWRIPWPRTSEA